MTDSRTRRARLPILLALLILAVSCRREQAVTDTTATGGAATGTQPTTTAAGTQAPAEPPSLLLNACLLLPESEAEGLLGQTLPAPSQNEFGEGPAAGSACHYDGLNARLSLVVRSAPKGRTPLSRFDAFVGSQLAAGNKPQEVQGVGERAVWLSGMGQLSVYDAKAELIVICTLKDEKKALETARKVATSALSRL